MTQRSMTATNRISTVIDVLQLGKKTGTLIVERGTGETFEEGTMVFVHGQVVQAAVGGYKGRDAATRLLSWQACRFAFTSNQPDRAREVPQTPSTQANVNEPTRNSYDQWQGNLQDYSGIQDEMSLRPLLSLYKEALDPILSTLEQRGFTRIHRRLLLLIDGKRSIRELAMLIGRTPNETMALLTELQQAGFIRL